MGQSKTRNWCTLLYPESCNPDWRSVVESWKIRAFASPVHDKDKTESGEAKKPHIHLMMMFDGSKTAASVKRLTDTIGAVGLEAVQSVGGMARYLCHLDDKDKAQYQTADVLSFGGADYQAAIADAGKEGNYVLIAEILAWVRENRCNRFCALMDYAAKERMDWFRVLCGPSHAVVYRYIRSFGGQ